MDTNSRKKILVTAGGGGHFAPALAVMKQLIKEKKAQVLFVGRKYAFEGDKAESFEYKTVQKLQIPFRTIIAGRLQRNIGIRALLSLLKIPVSLCQAYVLVRKERPDVILSFGGYIALPITFVGWLLRIPVVIHEQTMRAGLANRISGWVATKICLSFSSSEVYFPKNKTVLTGNPLREEIRNLTTPTAFLEGKEPIILVTGGSLGSHAINVLVEQCLMKLLKKYRLLHQTGDARQFQDYERLNALKDSLPEDLKKRYYLTKFVTPHEMASMMAQASLVIGRAGMNTVTELIYFRKPALLIPLPHGQRNEQLENANYLRSLGLAVVKNQDDLTHETMYTEIERMMDELDHYKLNKDPNTIIHKDAAEKIITTVLSLTENTSQATEEKTKA